MSGLEILIPLIIRAGVEGAYHIIKLVKENKEPTEEDWQKLIMLSRKKYDDYFT